MHLRRRIDLRDEEGTTLVELLVGMGMGMVVLAGLATLLIVTLHGNARIDARVEATDNASVVMTRIISELHSACVEPTVAPVQPGSTKTTLRFTHGAYGSTFGGAAAASEPATLTEITYSETEHTLTERDQSSVPRILLSNVSPISSSEPVFSYWKYENGSLAKEALSAEAPTGLSSEHAKETILVKIAFTAAPKSQPVRDTGADTAIRNSATLRLTPPSYSETAAALPCE
jgi:hypothetical protein